jgi:hypothetical protein
MYISHPFPLIPFETLTGSKAEVCPVRVFVNVFIAKVGQSSGHFAKAGAGFLPHDLAARTSLAVLVVHRSAQCNKSLV